MIFNEEVRKNWPPTKTDYKVGDRVKIIDLRAMEGSFERSFLGAIGTVESIDTEGEPAFIVHFFDRAYRVCAFWCNEMRPALPDELPTPLDANVNIDKMPFGWKAILLGTMRPAKKT